MACQPGACAPFVSAKHDGDGKDEPLPSTDSLLTGDAVYDGKKHALLLTSSRLHATPATDRSKELQIDLDDVYGVQPHAKHPRIFVIYSMPLKKRTRFERSKKSHAFQCETIDDASRWTAAIRAVLAGVPIGMDPLPSRRIFVIINPVGGTRAAKSIFEKQVAPIFAVGNVRATVNFTERAAHATEMTRTLNLSEYDAIVTVSGDGLLHEAVNGLFLREDWKEALRTPVGIIPAGSGNGLGRSVETPEPALAAFSVVKGHSRPFDIMSCQQGDSVLYGHLCFYWGIFADVDIESERYRWAGPARFTFSAIGRMSSIRKYRGRLSFLPWTPTPSESAQGSCDGSAPSEASAAGAAQAKPPSPAVLPGQPLPEGWETVETDFVSVVGMNAGWAAKDMFVAPYSHIHDGAIDITWVTAAEASSARLLAMFLDGESGEMSKHELVHYRKARAFVLEPLCDPPGILDVDGEQIRSEAIAIESHQGIARILCPKRLNLPVHPVPATFDKVAARAPPSAPESSSAKR